MKLGDLVRHYRENPDTARVGKKWENLEYEQLLTEVHLGLAIEEIARRHKRPPTSIVYRLYIAGMILLYNGYKLHEAASLTTVAPFILLKFSKRVVFQETVHLKICINKNYKIN